MGRFAGWHELAGAELAARADELDDLLATTGAPATARWAALEVWLRHNSREEAWAVVHETPGGIDAAAVFARRCHFGLWRIRTVGKSGEQSWIAAADADHARELAGELTDALARDGRPWTLLAADLPEPDLAVDALAERLPETEVRSGTAVPVLRFRPDGRLTDYLSRNTRAAVAKARNRIAAHGLRMELTWHREPVEIAAELPEVIELHRARNRQLRGTRSSTIRPSRPSSPTPCSRTPSAATPTCSPCGSTAGWPRSRSVSAAAAASFMSTPTTSRRAGWSTAAARSPTPRSSGTRSSSPE